MEASHAKIKKENAIGVISNSKALIGDIQEAVRKIERYKKERESVNKKIQGVCGLEEQTKKLSGLIEGAKNHGWWIPCENMCFVAERHNILKRDDRGLLHCENGHACAFPDGFEMYYWHGVRVPEEWIKNKRSLSAKDALTWDNVEQRRCACEILGWENILRELNAFVLSISICAERSLTT